MIELSVRCVDEAGGEGTRAQPTDVCSYVGQPQVYLEIDITNRGATEIGFPLTALQSQGPRVRLVDNESGRDYVLPASMPAPLVYTLLAPGRTVKLSWVIGREELERLGARRVDATAEISVTVNVRVGDALMPVTSAAKLRIVEQEQAKPLSR